MVNAAKEYATALFLLAKENKALSDYAEGLTKVKTQFDAQPAYVDMLASPVIPKAERLSAIEQAFANVLPDAVLVLMQLLCKSGHIRSFDTCYQAYMDAYNALEKTTKAHILSATELSNAEKEQLVKTLEQKTDYHVDAVFSVDPTLLGGITIEWNGIVVDGSLKNRLRELKEVITI